MLAPGWTLLVYVTSRPHRQKSPAGSGIRRLGEQRLSKKAAEPKDHGRYWGPMCYGSLAAAGSPQRARPPPRTATPTSRRRGPRWLPPLSPGAH